MSVLSILGILVITVAAVYDIYCFSKVRSYHRKLMIMYNQLYLKVYADKKMADDAQKTFIAIKPSRVTPVRYVPKRCSQKEFIDIIGEPDAISQSQGPDYTITVFRYFPKTEDDVPMKVVFNDDGELAYFKYGV